jgi:hypothetical protein
VQTLKPMELAMLVHAIFSRFDAAVKTKKLFKMDTVGDAYVVAGLLPEDGDAGHVCREMLQVCWSSMLDNAIKIDGQQK